MTNETKPDLLVDSEACAYLKCESRTLRAWRRRGLPFIKITNKAVRYRQNDLDRWLDLHRVQIRGGSR